MKTIALSKEQIDKLKAGATLLVIPMEPQPEMEDGVWYWKGRFFAWEAFNSGNAPEIEGPLGAVGERVAVDTLRGQYASTAWGKSHQPPLHIRLTAEPRINVVRGMTTEERIAAGFSTTLREHDAECYLREQADGEFGAETWAFFCPVEVL